MASALDSYGQESGGRLKRVRELIADVTSTPSGLVGVVLVGLHLAVAIVSPWIAPHDFATQHASDVLQAPSATYLFGTDHLGRDVFSRTLLGGRQALVITTLATVFAIAWGGLLGIVAGLIGGKVDEILMRVIDALLAIPWLLFVLMIISVMGTGGAVLIPTLALFFGLPVVRVARAASLDIVARDFIAAARARGERVGTIAFRELLPNVRDVLLVEGAMEWSWMLLGFSSLSFLGFGISPPNADWGLMVSDARLYLQLAPWTVLPPMMALGSLIIGINLVADALGKALGVDRARRTPL
jgi:peptide/nickel transport system permease protein